MTRRKEKISRLENQLLFNAQFTLSLLTLNLLTTTIVALPSNAMK